MNQPDWMGEAIRHAAMAMTWEELVADPIENLCRAARGHICMAFRYADGVANPLNVSSQDILNTYQPDWYTDDAVFPYMASMDPQYLIVPDPQLLDLEAWRASAAFHEFYDKYDMHHLLGVWPTRRRFGSDGMMGIMVARSKGEEVFDPMNTRPLWQTQEALTAAVARVERFSELQHHVSHLETLVSQHGLANVVWDRNGRLVWMSSPAKELLARQTSAKSILGNLAMELLQFVEKKRRDHPLSVVMMPLGAGRLRTAFSILRDAEGHAMVTAYLQFEALPAASLQKLSLAECNVLRALSTGLSNQEMAASLHISMDTVRTHLRRIFAKLGAQTRTQAALIAQSLGL